MAKHSTSMLQISKCPSTSLETTKPLVIVGLHFLSSVIWKDPVWFQIGSCNPLRNVCWLRRILGIFCLRLFLLDPAKQGLASQFYDLWRELPKSPKENMLIPNYFWQSASSKSLNVWRMFITHSPYLPKEEDGFKKLMCWLPSADHHQGQLAVEQWTSFHCVQNSFVLISNDLFLSFMEKVNDSQKFSKPKQDSV